MNISTKVRTYFPLAIILVVGLMCACGSPPSEITTPRLDQPSGPPDRVDIVYFHRPHRCSSCIYVEERVGYIVETYFQNEVDNGNLTFEIYNLGDDENVAIVNKYSAVGSQLFINTIRNDTDHVQHIQEIWFWDCLDNEEVFDETVRSAIEQSLKGKE